MDQSELRRLVDAEEKRRLAETDLWEFVNQAWHVVEPGVPFVPGWHIEIICEHLEAVSTGQIKRLLINIPPRHAKSTIVSVLWPMWEWTTKPNEKFLCASYAGTLSIRDNLKARRLVQSPWYQERWGDKVQLTGDQNAKQRFENTSTGYRIASSVGGTATGEGGSRLLLDDPHGAQDAQSDQMRETALEWFQQVWSTRLNDPQRDSMVTIMQRLHEQDISGYILRDLGDWEHVCLPAEWDGQKRKTFLGSYDVRKEVGELLWPQRFNHKVLNALKVQLGEYGTAGQLQQQPSPPGGGILKVECFRKWPHDKEVPAFEYVVQSYDCAFTEKTSGDPTACSVWGVFTHERQRNAMLLDCWAENMGYPQLREKAVEEWHSLYGGSDTDPMRKPRKADIVLVEAKASGQSLLQDLKQARVPAVPYNPGNADKVSRAHQAAPILELGNLWIPESKKTPGHVVTWAKAFVAQLERFPVSEHDDYVDTFTQCMIYFRDSGMLELPQADKDPIEEEDYHAKKKRKGNPYNC
jgi:predicted phage terminase large subunit-like protein